MFSDEDNQGADEEEINSAVSENNKQINSEFQQRWGWLELGHSVSDYKRDTLNNIMETQALDILTYATLLKEKEQLIKINTPNKNG